MKKVKKLKTITLNIKVRKTYFARLKLPEGICRRNTALEVVLTAWPPGPQPKSFENLGMEASNCRLHNVVNQDF